MRRAALTALLAAALGAPAGAESYRGIEVAPERRCTPYDRADYRYPQSVEGRIVGSIRPSLRAVHGTLLRERARDGH